MATGGAGNVEWIGSLADWVSGLGSLLAVGAAAWIARSESKRATAAENRQIAAENKRVAEASTLDNKTRTYLVEILDKLEAKTQWTYIKLIDSTLFATHDAVFTEWKTAAKEAYHRIVRVQAFPAVSLSVYLECDKLIHILVKEEIVEPLRKTTPDFLSATKEQIAAVRISLNPTALSSEVAT